MSDRDRITVMNEAIELEELLRTLGARGSGLTQLCISIEHLLPREIAWSIKTIAKIRNKVSHEKGAKVSDMSEFEYQASSTIAYLRKAAEPGSDPERKGITISVPDRLISEIPIAEIEWFLKQECLFERPNKSESNDDIDD